MPSSRTVKPLVINLALLLLAVVINGVSGRAQDQYALAPFLCLLAGANGVIAFLFLLFERRRDAGYAGGLFLSALLLLLIGFGMCMQGGTRT